MKFGIYEYVYPFLILTVDRGLGGGFHSNDYFFLILYSESRSRLEKAPQHCGTLIIKFVVVLFLPISNVVNGGVWGGGGEG